MVGDASNFAVQRCFDVVVAGDIIEHLHDFKGFFHSVEQALKPGGKLIITTAQPYFFVRIAQAVLRGKVYENPEHTVWFSIGTMTELINRYGFKVVHAEYGSSEPFLYRLFFLPKVIRHTSIWIVAEKNNNDNNAENGMLKFAENPAPVQAAGQAARQTAET